MIAIKAVAVLVAIAIAVKTWRTVMADERERKRKDG